MANVVSLSGDPIKSPGEPVETVVALARSILEMAESGNINGLAVCFAYADGTFQGKRAGMADSYGMIGVMGSLLHIVTKSTLGDE